VGVSCVAQQDSTDEEWTRLRQGMVAQLRQPYDIRDERVLQAMAKVRRHLYIPAAYRRYPSAYGDHPCPIGHEQTISQPYIVAYMTQQVGVRKGDKVLEIGTGSGYQAAVLAEMGAEVFTIEIVPELADHARGALKAEGYGGVRVLTGDGYKGWPEHAPFDVVIVTCAPEEAPQALVDQLKEGGRMIVPVGSFYQRLVILRKKGGKVTQEDDLAVRFVPMVHGKDVPATKPARPPEPAK
jgi:protein-L-isoaspartate(D-aspartate) O-methyltransferase